VKYFVSAQLEVISTTLPEHKGRGPHRGARELLLTTATGSAVRPCAGSCRVSTTVVPKIHGRPVGALPLRDGDIIEMGPELTVRFTMVRVRVAFHRQFVLVAAIARAGSISAQAPAQQHVRLCAAEAALRVPASSCFQLHSRTRCSWCSRATARHGTSR